MKIGALLAATEWLAGGLARQGKRPL